MTPRIDHKVVFDRLEEPFMILDRDLRYVDMNQSYLRAVGRGREDILGRHVFEAFPSEGEPRRLLEESFARVLSGRRTDHLPLIPYAISNAAGEAEERYWSATHTPLLDDADEVAFIIQNTQEVTELHRLRQAAGGDDGPVSRVTADLLDRAQAVQQVNDVLLAQHVRLRDLVMQAPGFMAVLSGPDHVFELANNAYAQLVGHRPVMGKTVAEALPEIVGQGYIKLLNEVRETGEAFVGREMRALLQRTADSPPEERFLDLIYQPITDPHGKVEGIFVEGYDVTDRIRAREHERLLINELNHRVKNTLATVQAMATQTLRQYAQPAEFAAAFHARVQALSQAHNALTEAQWQGAELRSLLSQELAPFGSDNVRLVGEDLRLTPRMALSLGLVFHELTTNAAKYGALSAPQGQVVVSWARSDEAPERLNIDWRETGGPPVRPPERRGFGSRLIERSVRGELDGELRKTFAEGGFVCEISIPLGHSQTGDQPVHGAAFRSGHQ